jgi:transposase
MYTPLPEIKEPLDELTERLRTERNGLRKLRLHVLVLVASQKVSTREEAAQRLALHRTTVCRWLRVYQREGLTGLLSIGEAGAPSGTPRLTPAMTEVLQQRLDDPRGFGSYVEVQHWLYDEYGQRIPYSTVHRWVRYDLKAKLKRPRPEHPKKNLTEAAGFANHLDQCVSLLQSDEHHQETPRPLRLFFQDESRLGLHLPLPDRLTGFGVKPIQPCAPLYEYYWLYAAVEPATGESCWCELPHLDSACFQAFLKHLSQAHPNSLNLLVVDNAPAHTASTLELPDNILLLHLPPYSPELNPVERLWQHLKAQIDVFDQHVRSSLTALRDHVADIIQRYRPERLRSLTGYGYILNAVNELG